MGLNVSSSFSPFPSITIKQRLPEVIISVSGSEIFTVSTVCDNLRCRGIYTFELLTLSLL